MSTNTNKTNSSSFFHRGKSIILLIACALIITGMTLMTGDESTPQAFCPDIFSTRRIVVAPMLCFAGYILIVVGIVWKRFEV